MATTPTTKKILTIDDEQAIVDLIVDILETNNYSAISATKWTEAVDALNHENPDLILLDLKMPTIHGTSMLDFIVSEGFDIPVIVVSGFVTDQVSQELRSQGVKSIIRKPFKARTLLGEIEKNLKQDDLSRPEPQDTGSVLFNRPATPHTTSSIDSLYGTSDSDTKPNTKPNQPPANDILQALKRNAAKSEPAKEPTTSSAPKELLDVLKKQAEKSQPTLPTPTTAQTPPPPQTPPPVANPTSGGPPPMDNPINNPITSAPLSTPQMSPDFGRKEPSSRPRRARRKMDRGNMMFMGAITVVCVLVAGFLAVMQWVASEAPVAMEKIKSDLEDGVNSQMTQQMQQMKLQMQQQQAQQQQLLKNK